MKPKYKSKNNKSGFIGVFFDKKSKKWKSEITINKKRIYIGIFDTPELASQAYQRIVEENGLIRLNEITKEEKIKKAKEYKKQWDENHKDEYKKYWSERFQRIYKEKSKEMIQKQIKKNKLLKELVMSVYGGECICCKERNISFLTLDHQNNNGAKHRKELNSNGGTSFYRWLKKNNYPKDLGIVVMCWNCNCARHYDKDKICPHKKQNNENLFEEEINVE